ncbi:hypothetical protein, partial [Flavobacterium sasangense]|uniref:hypothetical protein n=1 Tax=Flavobacterium sasangense TaxID=503361 RepID=UPI001B800AF0
FFFDGLAILKGSYHSTSKALGTATLNNVDRTLSITFLTMGRGSLYLDVRGTLHQVPCLFHYLFLMAWS